MNNIIDFFKRTLNRYIDSYKRFYIGQGLIVVYGLFLCVEVIIGNDIESTLVISVSLAFILSLLVSFLISYNSNNKILYITIPLILFVALSVALSKCFDNFYVIFGYIGLCAIIACLVYDSMIRNTKGNLLIYLSSKSLYVSVLCSILTIGFLICILGFQLLIYESENMIKIFSIIFIITEVIINGTLLVSYLPYKDEELKYNDVFTSLLSKIPLTLYYLLLVILYIYLFKIVITWTLPVGVINWFASFALYFYIYFIFASTDNYFLSKFHQKYGSFVLMPIFIIQQISIFIRIDAYGLTELRVLSLAFNLIALVLIVLCIFKKRNLFFIISSCIIFIFTIVPYTNIIDLPVLEQEARLKKILIDNDMYKDGKIINNPTISNETKDKIVSCYDFLIASPSNKESLINKDISFNIIFGFDKDYYFLPDENEENNTLDISDGIQECSYFSVFDTLNIEEYKKYEMLDYIQIKDDENMIDFCEDLYQKYGSYYKGAELIYKISDNEIMYIENLYFERDSKGIISNIGVKGFKFYK